MRRPLLLALFAVLFIVQNASAHNDEIPVWEIVAFGDMLGFFGWSPDGQWIAYFTNDAKEFEAGPAPTTADLHLLELETGETCVFEDISIGASYPGNGLYAWLPEHRLLMFGDGVQIVTPCTGERRDISGDFPELVYGVWAISPDHTSLLISGRNTYYVYEIASGDAQVVTGITPNNDDGSDSVDLLPSWSPDSQQIAVQINRRGSVYVIDAQNGEATLVFDEPRPTPTSFGIGALPELRYAKPAQRFQLSDDSVEFNSIRWLADDVLYIPDTLSYGGMIVSTDGEIVMQDGDKRIARAAPYEDVYRVLLYNADDQLWVYYSETGETELLERESWGIVDFMPDGRSLFLQDIPQGLYTKRYDFLLGVKWLSEIGLPMQRLLVTGARPESAAWTADGTRLAFGMGEALAVLDWTAEGGQQWLPVWSASEVRPEAWSPDGVRLAVRTYNPQEKRNDLLIFTPR